MERYANLLIFAWKNSWNHFGWIYFWRVLAFWNHCDTLAPLGAAASAGTRGLVVRGGEDDFLWVLSSAVQCGADYWVSKYTVRPYAERGSAPRPL